MENSLRRIRTTIYPCLVGAAVAFSLHVLSAGDDPSSVDSSDSTLRLFKKLDSTKGGKLKDFYLVADVYKDPANPEMDAQHILKVDYDKALAFGKFQIVVRSVGKIHADQMKAYTPKEFFEFGLADQEKYMRSNPGPLGKPGDMYLKATADRPLASEPITDEVRKNYERLVGQYLLPALEKSKQ